MPPAMRVLGSLLTRLQSSSRSSEPLWSIRDPLKSRIYQKSLVPENYGVTMSVCFRRFTSPCGGLDLETLAHSRVHSMPHGLCGAKSFSTTVVTSDPSVNPGQGQEECERSTGAFRTTWNLISCNAAISRLAQQGRSAEAFALFFRMQDERIRPNRITFLSLLKAFTGPACLEGGKRAHSLIVEAHLESDVRVGTALVCMYFKCGSARHAHEVFSTLQKRDVILWNAMIEGYTQNGLRDEALDVFREMEREGHLRDKATFISILKTCDSAQYLEEGRRLHGDIINLGFESDVRLQTALVSMYCKCEDLVDARQLFNKFPQRDVILWTTMIAGYAQGGHSEEAFDLFRLMRQTGVRPNKMTFISMLKACGRPELLQKGKWLHGHIVRAGYELDERVGTALISMYCKCRSLVDARRIFDKIPKRNVIQWTALIAGSSRNGRDEEALDLFDQMLREGVKPNEVTTSSIVNACARLGAV